MIVFKGARKRCDHIQEEYTSLDIRFWRQKNGPAVSSNCTCYLTTFMMATTSVDDKFDFAFILPDVDQADQVSSRYSCEVMTSDLPEDFRAIPMHKIRCNESVGVVTARIGYTENAMSLLFRVLSFLECNQVIMFATAASCSCVKAKLNELISIETLRETSNEDVKLKPFLLPKRTKMVYPATAVSECRNSLGNSRKRSRRYDVQVLVNLGIPIDVVPKDTVIVALNIENIPCNYKPADVKRALFEDELHSSQSLVDAVAALIPDIATADYKVSMPLTPPGTCKKQKSATDELKDLFPRPTGIAECNNQEELIRKFVGDFVVVKLHPGYYQDFARCLGLSEIDYAHIKQDYSDQNTKELLYQIIRVWFDTRGSCANVNTFNDALQKLKHKGLQDLFLFYCQENRKP